MNARVMTLAGLLVVSLAAGVAVGEWFFRLYLSAIPPIALSDFNASSSRVAHLAYGGAVGLLLFAFALIGMAVGRLMAALGRRAAMPAAPVA